MEPEVEHEHPTSSYREVLRLSLLAVARTEGLELPQADEHTLSKSLPGWSPFPEVPEALASLRDRDWRLGLLSNTDPDLIAASLAAIGVPVDEVVTAADAGSYKPAPGHWRRFAERTGATEERWVHVAASRFHDVGPASELGLPVVWINRLGEPPDPRARRELSDLLALPDVLDELVP